MASIFNIDITIGKWSRYYADADVWYERIDAFRKTDSEYIQQRTRLLFINSAVPAISSGRHMTDILQLVNGMPLVVRGVVLTNEN